MREEKKLLLDEIKNDIKDATSLIVAKYSSLTPEFSWKLSQKLSKVGSKFKIAKKRMIQKAACECDFKIDLENLKDHVGLIFIKKDPLEVLKAFVKFSEENDEMLEAIIGKIDKEIYSSEDIKTLAKLPSKKELQSQILALMESLKIQILSTMDNMLTSIIFCIENKKEKKDEV